MAKGPTGSNYSESIPAITILIPNYSHTLNLCPYTNGLASLPAVNPICLQTCFSTPSRCQHLRISNQNYDNWERYLGVFHGIIVQPSSPIRIPTSVQFRIMLAHLSHHPCYTFKLTQGSARHAQAKIRNSHPRLRSEQRTAQLQRQKWNLVRLRFVADLCGNMFKMELKGAGRRSLYIFKQRYISLFPPC
jgi:hypothetical protein